MLVRLLRDLFGPRAARSPQSASDIGELQAALRLQKNGELPQAEATLRAILNRDAGNFDVLHLLGNNLRLQNRPAEAVTLLQRVIEARPDYAEAYYTLANAVRALGQHDLATGHFMRALELKPDFLAAAISLANVLRSRGRPDDAEFWYRRAAEINPHFAEVYYNLANLLHSEGRLDEAIAGYQRAITVRPDFAAAHSALVYSLNFHPGYDLEDVFKAHLEWAWQHASP